MTNNDQSAFGHFHPLPSFLYLTVLAAVTVFCTNPVLLGCSFLGGLSFGAPEPPVEEHDGDINGDGNTNTADAVFAMRYALGLIELTETQLIHGDVNEDGVVNIADAIGIMRIAMGLN